MILLDTHVLVWWVSGAAPISRRAAAAIAAAREEGEVLVSAISAWEVAMLVRRGRLDLTIDVADWVAKCEALPFLRFVPVDPRIAVRSVLLPPPSPADSADRLIAATALVLGVPLATKDAALRRVPGLRTVW